MRCPFCKKSESRVLESRSLENGFTIRRRRECTSCSRRFTTYERVDDVPLWVIKKDGRRELFNRDKLLTGIMKACEKRPTALETLSEIVDEIERELRNQPEREIPSKVIGQIVMSHLLKLDKVAYVRFASVYREFQDVGEILDCLEEMGVRGRRQ
ncbi:MAG: transcriptional regulator NrdR [Thermacetogeniaceae bacterium]|jgi:transcriptional repressor NrdR|nr:transcriptional regulator NrdR [Syntrophomonadaceae bacterium]